jgi:3-phosphoshikimate 1-carboxyvinyltransferase
MSVEIHPGGPIRATVRVPGSKSYTNRALVCAALADGQSTLRSVSDSDDTALLANGLNQFGVLVRPAGGDLLVSGTGGHLTAPRFPIPVGNAGTTFRFLLSLACLARGRTVFSVSQRMAERPIDDLLESLRALGASVQAMPWVPQFEVHGLGLAGGRASVKGGRSSQFLSSVLMVAPYAAGKTTIELEGTLVSEGYVAMTLEVMRQFGVRPGGGEGHLYEIVPTRYRPSTYDIEPDASSATYPLAAAAITAGEVLVEQFRQGLQADAGFRDILLQMGCRAVSRPGAAGICCDGPLRGIEVDMNTMPDAVPALVAVALFAGSPTHITNIAHLRYKESDRMGTVQRELARTGADIRVGEDFLEIHPAPLHGAELDPHDDHRLAMSFALLGLRVPGIAVRNPSCVRKSFPQYWEMLSSLTSVSMRGEGSGAEHS